MRIAVYGKSPEREEDRDYIVLLFDCLLKKYDNILVWKRFYDAIKPFLSQTNAIKTFSNKEELKQNTDILLSLGGDGTMLETVDYIIETDIAVLGVNLGHLGFLTSARREDIKHLVTTLSQNKFSIEKRPILQVHYDFEDKKKHFAVNEACFLSSNRGNLIDLDLYVNDNFMASVAGDGVIISTSTGSTAYNMSAGGPIVTPDSQCICITPIAPHNLTFRPVILSDKDIIKVHIPNTDNPCKMLVDGNSVFERTNGNIIISKSSYFWKLVRIEKQNFFKAIRDKLMWGTTPYYLSGNK